MLEIERKFFVKELPKLGMTEMVAREVENVVLDDNGK